jgi:hypothetical protein
MSDNDLVKAAYVHRVDGALSIKNPTLFYDICDDLVARAERGRFRAVAEAFSRLAPAEPNTWPSSAWRFAGCYNLALVLERAERFDEARAYMERSELDAAPDGEPLLYPSMVLTAAELCERQEHSLQKCSSRPIIISSLPRSASGFVSSTLAALFDAPLMRVSLVDCVVERWVRQVNRGGAVTHNHFPATGGNLEALARAGVERIFVQVRDPREAIWSLHHHFVDLYRLHREHSSSVLERSTLRPELDAEIQSFTPRVSAWLMHHRYQAALQESADQDEVEAFWRDAYIAHICWLEAWIAASRDTSGPDVEFVRYDDVRRAPFETFERILSLSGNRVDEAALRARLDTQGKPHGYRAGDPDDWRQMPAACQKLLWRLTPLGIRDFFGLQE